MSSTRCTWGSHGGCTACRRTWWSTQCSANWWRGHVRSTIPSKWPLALPARWSSSSISSGCWKMPIPNPSPSTNSSTSMPAR
ncbi:hypothetical protein Ahy_A01g001753 isoform C [Arachis hypogaea]|uniref:Uncharacterized protein n=1 Tax=Arachis hypogaea TaxID=3818 RepID=A0A445EPB5_ARAHY|nr:hypothetical protein Ahy_A01g001753 isoform C [Arachis hypogaea]